MSTAGQHDDHEDAKLVFYPAEEALRRARPLPPPESRGIEGLTEEERDAFLKVIANL